MEPLPWHVGRVPETSVDDLVSAFVRYAKVCGEPQVLDWHGYNKLRKANGKAEVSSILKLGPLLLELTQIQPEARFKPRDMMECIQALMKKFSNINLLCHGIEVEKLGEHMCAKNLSPKLTSLLAHWRRILRDSEDMLTCLTQLPRPDQKQFLDLVKKGRKMADIKVGKRSLKRNISQVSASSAASSPTVDSVFDMMLMDNISDDVSEGTESENDEKESEEEPSKDNNGEEVSEGKESENGEEVSQGKESENGEDVSEGNESKNGEESEAFLDVWLDKPGKDDLWYPYKPWNALDKISQDAMASAEVVAPSKRGHQAKQIPKKNT